jgi:dimeric dUTPase (all-alpha-NTP-PPase superfamily)
MVEIEQFKNLLELQDELNIATCGEKWKAGICEKSGKTICWKSAVTAECGEALESLGYKHWKKQDIDMNNAQMELIDILHFLLSQALSLHGTSENIATRFIKDNISYKDDLSNIESIAEILELSLIDAPIAAIEYLFDNSDKFNLTTQQIYDLYMAKHWLNGFRQENGYQDGTYIKLQTYPEITETIEDNELVVLLVKDHGLDKAKELFASNYKLL